MSESSGTVAAHEAYAFACMRCGHGWEQGFEIEHRVDIKGKTFVVYKADGRTVPSPLTSPSCPTCDGHVVRIMRSGTVAAVREAGRSYGTATGRQPVREKAQAVRADRIATMTQPSLQPAYDGDDEAPEHPKQPRHWHPHLPEFLRHLLHHERHGHV